MVTFTKRDVGEREREAEAFPRLPKSCYSPNISHSFSRHMVELNFSDPLKLGATKHPLWLIVCEHKCGISLLSKNIKCQYLIDMFLFFCLGHSGIMKRDPPSDLTLRESDMEPNTKWHID